MEQSGENNNFAVTMKAIKHDTSNICYLLWSVVSSVSLTCCSSSSKLPASEKAEYRKK